MFSFSTLWRFSSLTPEEYYPPFWSNNIYTFEAMEDHSIEPSFLKQTPLKISNIAMRCPWESKEEIPSLCSPMAQERDKACQRLAEAANKAIALQTPYVIVWPGRISWQAFPFTELEKISPEQKIALRKKKAAPYLERICRILFDIAKKYPDLVWCLPPARHLEDFPLFAEMEAILDDLKSIRLGYWHNPVNCHFLQKLGMEGQEPWLFQYARNMAGVHLEDAAGMEGLYPAGTGEISFKDIKNDLPKQAIRVLRIDSRFSLQEVFFAFQHLQQAGLVE